METWKTEPPRGKESPTFHRVISASQGESLLGGDDSIRPFLIQPDETVESRETKGAQRQDSKMPRTKDFVARLAAFSSQRHPYKVRNPRQVISLEGGGEKRQSMIS